MIHFVCLIIQFSFSLPSHSPSRFRTRGSIAFSQFSFCARQSSLALKFSFVPAAPDFSPSCFDFLPGWEGKFPTSFAKGFSGAGKFPEAPPTVSRHPLYRQAGGISIWVLEASAGCFSGDFLRARKNTSCHYEMDCDI